MTIPLRKPAPFVLLALFVVTALLPAAIAAWGRDYWRPDEPDYAQHTREMVQRGDYVVPYQKGWMWSQAAANLTRLCRMRSSYA